MKFVYVINMEVVFTSWAGEPEKEPSDVYLLRLKSNMKELASKAFNETEKRAFDEADAAEWTQWLANGSVAIVPANEEHRVPRDLIFTAPMLLFGLISPRGWGSWRQHKDG